MAEHRDYERSDVSVKAALVAALILSVSVAAVAGVVWLMRGEWAEQVDVVITPRPDVNAERQVEPRLSRDPPAEWAEVKQEFDRITSTAAWLDEDRTVARIPVEDAMDMLVEQGWPEGAP